MATTQERLNEVSAKIQYLKAEKVRIEAEKKKIEEELAKEGITDLTKLPEIIATKKSALEATKLKFSENLTKFELKVTDLESKVK
jgi:predicted  nucleic acid-binding Zn-ribbon protein